MKVTFKEDNNIPYVQDFSAFKNIPHGIEFTAMKSTNGYKLIADGYGDLRAHFNYGNGSIYTFNFKNQLE